MTKDMESGRDQSTCKRKDSKSNTGSRLEGEWEDNDILC